MFLFLYSINVSDNKDRVGLLEDCSQNEMFQSVELGIIYLWSSELDQNSVKYLHVPTYMMIGKHEKMY